MNSKKIRLDEAADVIEEILASGGEFNMSPKGVSMLPLIVSERDSVVLKRDFVNTAQKYDIAFYRRPNGQFVLHRVLNVCKNGTYVMCGDNQIVLEKDVPASSIIGIVSRIVRNGKEIDLGGFWYSIYVYLWTKMFIRKPIKFLISVFKKFLKAFAAW